MNIQAGAICDWSVAWEYLGTTRKRILVCLSPQPHADVDEMLTIRPRCGPTPPSR